MENFALIFSAIFIGYILSKSDSFSKETPLILNQFILYISAPALVLLKIPQLSFSIETLIPVFIAWSIMSISAIAVFYLSKLFSFTKEVDIRALFLKILSFPPFIALVIALFFMGTSFHPIIQSVLASLAGTIIPLALVAVGLQLRFKLPKEDIKPFKYCPWDKTYLCSTRCYFYLRSFWMGIRSGSCIHNGIIHDTYDNGSSRSFYGRFGSAP